MKCPICDTHELIDKRELAMKSCLDCANSVGLIPMPPASRPPKPCSTCGGHKFLRSIPREHSVGTKATTRQTSARMVLTHPVHGATSIWHDGADQIDIERGWGLLEVYACYGCGKVEWFCSDVANVPIHPHLMTDVVEYDAATPYR